MAASGCRGSATGAAAGAVSQASSASSSAVLVIRLQTSTNGQNEQSAFCHGCQFGVARLISLISSASTRLAKIAPAWKANCPPLRGLPSGCWRR